MSATITKAELERIAPRVQRTTRKCVDCSAEIPAARYRCERCAEEPDPSNGHTGICAVPTCGAEVPVSEYCCQACADDYRDDEAADLWRDERGGR